MGKGDLCALYVLSMVALALGVVGVFSYYYIDAAGQELNQNSTLRNLVRNGSPFILYIMSAPITVIDFSDFQCYLCNRFVKNTEPQINETYIQTGKAALVFKHLPNRGFDSTGVALAAQCTNDQGKIGSIINYFIVTKKLLTPDG